MNKNFVFLLGLLLVTGCKSISVVDSDSSIDSRLRQKSIIKKISANSLIFNSLQWRGQLSFSKNGKDQRINTLIRVKKGERIWVNGSVIFPLVRLLITPTQFQFYEKINRKYGNLDYQQIGKLLGYPIEFKMIECALTARPLDIRALRRSKLTYKKNNYLLTSKKRGFTISWIYDASFRLVEQQLKNRKTSVSVSYNDFKLIENQWVPENISASIIVFDSSTTINLKSKHTILNKSFEMPFTVPKSYKEVEIL